MEYLDMDTQGTSQLLSSVSYSELHYDPNWRTNLKTNGLFTENPKIGIEEYQPEEYSQSCGDIQGLEINGQYRCIIDMDSVVVETPHMAFSQPDQPYHLHPPGAQSSAASLGFSNFSVANESGKSSRRRSLERHKNGVVNVKNVNIPHQLTDDVNASEFQIRYQQEPRHTQQGPSQKQKLTKSTLTSPKGAWNKNLGRKTKDIVEYNKMTLGHNASRCGSYVGLHMLKQERPHHVNGEAVSTENQDDSSDLAFRLQHGQDSVIQLTSLLGNLHWNHLQLTLQAGTKQTDTEKPSHMSPEGLNKQLIQQNQRTLPLSNDGEEQNLGPDKVHIKQVLQSFSRTRAISLSQTLDPYPVLPPIGKSATNTEHKLGPDQCVNTAHPIHKSSSDSYLSQLEKQKKLKDKVTYKQAKLYSDVMCMQTKKKRGIPFLPAKDLEDDDKKVPRTKALEYAKTIAKPPLQFQPKQRQKQTTKDFTESAPYLQGLDVTQLATLEVLRKRHEQEKQVVAHFKKVHLI